MQSQRFSSQCLLSLVNSSALEETHAFVALSPPLVFAVIRLAVSIRNKFKVRFSFFLSPLIFQFFLFVQSEEEKKFGSKLLTFVMETIKASQSKGFSELALRLNLQAAQAASITGFESASYDFVSQAMTIYEDEIADSLQQYRAITLVIGTLCTMKFADTESYENLITKTAKQSMKLMRKSDQCRAVCMSSHLFWRSGEGSYRDGKRVLECLQKSLKIADSSMDTSTNAVLFIEILNHYLFYFESRTESITVKYLSGLIALIVSNIGSMDSASADAAAASGLLAEHCRTH